MTAAVEGATRGRPVTTAEGLQVALARSRMTSSGLRENLRVEKAEGIELATVVRAHARRMHLAVVADRPDLALFDGAAIVAAADRFLRQRGQA